MFVQGTEQIDFFMKGQRLIATYVFWISVSFFTLVC